ncbi:hypothetical protein [Chelatococcus asaccharovorans]|uniref:Uncharacterized protein n=1 Tax=Chelatococcus asaccharovorans TaxID=28210 RepID=A0A2V3U1V2_9HYPH|nr:hypothetical protein [Chelatococcus asaccharovorans]MBS7702413.1 hypothetical protein [Chelatococcus asaccharovorans]PXW56385.1 hypothetical protein C7450_108135 [Chelatococcus asaccharovorans]CAH1670239.1 conserved hypothetical protein [Chelatococcus asaccharovorans]CAH1678294.1 conserved hypothetical protein [Chelatococcus asaccharovorans]
MAKFLENLGDSLGGFAQSAYDGIGDGLKAGMSLWGSGMAKFLEFDGWLLQKAADGIIWSASTVWDLATGGLVLRFLESDETAGNAAPAAGLDAPATSGPVTVVNEAQPGSHDRVNDDAVLLVGLPEPMPAIDWHPA